MRKGYESLFSNADLSSSTTTHAGAQTSKLTFTSLQDLKFGKGNKSKLNAKFQLESIPQCVSKAEHLAQAKANFQRNQPNSGAVCLEHTVVGNTLQQQSSCQVALVMSQHNLHFNSLATESLQGTHLGAYKAMRAHKGDMTLEALANWDKFSAPQIEAAHSKHDTNSAYLKHEANSELLKLEAKSEQLKHEAKAEVHIISASAPTVTSDTQAQHQKSQADSCTVHVDQHSGDKAELAICQAEMAVCQDEMALSVCHSELAKTESEKTESAKTALVNIEAHQAVEKNLVKSAVKKTVIGHIAEQADIGHADVGHVTKHSGVGLVKQAGIKAHGAQQAIDSVAKKANVGHATKHSGVGHVGVEHVAKQASGSVLKQAMVEDQKAKKDVSVLVELEDAQGYVDEISSFDETVLELTGLSLSKKELVQYQNLVKQHKTLTAKKQEKLSLLAGHSLFNKIEAQKGQSQFYLLPGTQYQYKNLGFSRLFIPLEVSEGIGSLDSKLEVWHKQAPVVVNTTAKAQPQIKSIAACLVDVSRMQQSRPTFEQLRTCYQTYADVYNSYYKYQVEQEEVQPFALQDAKQWILAIKQPRRSQHSTSLQVMAKDNTCTNHLQHRVRVIDLVPMYGMDWSSLSMQESLNHVQQNCVYAQHEVAYVTQGRVYSEQGYVEAIVTHSSLSQALPHITAKSSVTLDGREVIDAVAHDECCEVIDAIAHDECRELVDVVAQDGDSYCVASMQQGANAVGHQSDFVARKVVVETVEACTRDIQLDATLSINLSNSTRLAQSTPAMVSSQGLWNQVPAHSSAFEPSDVEPSELADKDNEIIWQAKNWFGEEQYKSLWCEPAQSVEQEDVAKLEQAIDDAIPNTFEYEAPALGEFLLESIISNAQLMKSKPHRRKGRPKQAAKSVAQVQCETKLQFGALPHNLQDKVADLDQVVCKQSVVEHQQLSAKQLLQISQESAKQQCMQQSLDPTDKSIVGESLWAEDNVAGAEQVYQLCKQQSNKVTPSGVVEGAYSNKYQQRAQSDLPSELSKQSFTSSEQSFTSSQHYSELHEQSFTQGGLPAMPSEQVSLQVPVCKQDLVEILSWGGSVCVKANRLSLLKSDTAQALDNLAFLEDELPKIQAKSQEFVDLKAKQKILQVARKQPGNLMPHHVLPSTLLQIKDMHVCCTAYVEQEGIKSNWEQVALYSDFVHKNNTALKFNTHTAYIGHALLSYDESCLKQLGSGLDSVCLIDGLMTKEQHQAMQGHEGKLLSTQAIQCQEGKHLSTQVLQGQDERLLATKSNQQVKGEGSQRLAKQEQAKAGSVSKVKLGQAQGAGQAQRHGQAQAMAKGLAKGQVIGQSKAQKQAKGKAKAKARVNSPIGSKGEYTLQQIAGRTKGSSTMRLKNAYLKGQNKLSLASLAKLDSSKSVDAVATSTISTPTQVLDQANVEQVLFMQPPASTVISHATAYAAPSTSHKVQGNSHMESRVSATMGQVALHIRCDSAVVYQDFIAPDMGLYNSWLPDFALQQPHSFAKLKFSQELLELCSQSLSVPVVESNNETNSKLHQAQTVNLDGAHQALVNTILQTSVANLQNHSLQSELHIAVGDALDSKAMTEHISWPSGAQQYKLAKMQDKTCLQASGTEQSTVQLLPILCSQVGYTNYWLSETLAETNMHPQLFSTVYTLPTLNTDRAYVQVETTAKNAALSKRKIAVLTQQEDQQSLTEPIAKLSQVKQYEAEQEQESQFVGQEQEAKIAVQEQEAKFSVQEQENLLVEHSLACSNTVEVLDSHMWRMVAQDGGLEHGRASVLQIKTLRFSQDYEVLSAQQHRQQSRVRAYGAGAEQSMLEGFYHHMLLQQALVHTDFLPYSLLLANTQESKHEQVNVLDGQQEQVNALDGKHEPQNNLGAKSKLGLESEAEQVLVPSGQHLSWSSTQLASKDKLCLQEQKLEQKSEPNKSLVATDMMQVVPQYQDGQGLVHTVPKTGFTCAQDWYGSALSSTPTAYAMYSFSGLNLNISAYLTQERMRYGADNLWRFGQEQPDFFAWSKDGAKQDEYLQLDMDASQLALNTLCQDYSLANGLQDITFKQMVTRLLHKADEYAQNSEFAVVEVVDKPISTQPHALEQGKLTAKAIRNKISKIQSALGILPAQQFKKQCLALSCPEKTS